MFCDWLHIHQQHPPGAVPDVRGGYVLRLSPEGEIETTTSRSTTAEGSFESSIQVRSSGGLVSFSGNPSRWGRPDNVFGLSFAQALEVVNGILASFDLPPFTASPLEGWERWQSWQGTETRLSAPVSADGAYLTGIHVTENYSVGANWREALRALGSGVWHGRKGREQESCWTWGSRRHTRLKWYAKGPELRSHRVKTSVEVQEYRDRLSEWCNAEGVLRFEVELGRDTLRRLGLRQLAEFDWGRAMREAERIREKLNPGVLVGGVDFVRSHLVASGCSEHLAGMLQALAAEWVTGADVWGRFKPSTSAKYRALLRPMGIDIRHPCRDVSSAVAVFKVRPVARVVELVPASPPDWYRQAA